MIITGFDGRNLAVVVDALEVKSLVYALSLLVPEDYSTIAEILQAEGFQLDSEQTTALVKSAHTFLGQYSDVARPFKARPVGEDGNHEDTKNSVN